MEAKLSFGPREILLSLSFSQSMCTLFTKLPNSLYCNFCTAREGRLRLPAHLVRKKLINRVYTGRQAICCGLVSHGLL